MSTITSSRFRDLVNRALLRNRTSAPVPRNLYSRVPQLDPDQIELNPLRPRPPPFRDIDRGQLRVEPEGEGDPLIPRPQPPPVSAPPAPLSTVIGDAIFDNIAIVGPLIVTVGTAIATAAIHHVPAVIEKITQKDDDMVKGSKRKASDTFVPPQPDDVQIVNRLNQPDVINVDADHPMDQHTAASNDAIHSNVPLVGGLKRKVDLEIPDDVKRQRLNNPIAKNIFNFPVNDCLYLKAIDFRKQAFHTFSSAATGAVLTDVKLIDLWANNGYNKDTIQGRQLRVDELHFNFRHNVSLATAWCPDASLGYALVYDVAPTGVLPTYDDIIQPPYVGAPDEPADMNLNQDNQRRFTILFQDHIDLPTVPIQDKVTTYTRPVVRNYHFTRKIMKANLPVHLIGDPPFNGIAEIAHGALYWVQCQINSDNAATSQWRTLVNIRAYYYDRSYNN